VIWLLEMPWEKGKIAGAYGATRNSQQPTSQNPANQNPTANGQQPKSDSQGLRNSQVLRD
jgi:hypothetical protein